MIPCPIDCSGGCPVCAPEDHTGRAVYDFIVTHFALEYKGVTKEATYSCRYCEAKFKTYIRLCFHAKDEHPDKPGYSFPSCQ